jgi:ATP-dependent 26S proteasome regulatory subunit
MSLLGSRGKHNPDGATQHVTQEDFEMAVAKVMKKDSDKNVSLKQLWK